MVGKFKHAMKKITSSNKDIGLCLANWLLNYHNCPHPRTGVEPSVRFLGRRIRSALSLVHPLSSSVVRGNEERKVAEAEKTLRRFDVGQQVLYRDVLNGKWIRASVTDVSDKQYVLETAEGKQITKHVDHIKEFHVTGRGTDGSTLENAKGPIIDDRSKSDILEPQPGHSPNKQLDRLVTNSPGHLLEPLFELPDIPNNLPNTSSSDIATKLTRPVRSKTKPSRLEYSKLGG